MTGREDRAAMLRTLWDQRGIDDTEIAVDHRGTIVPEQLLDETRLSLLDELPEAASPDGPLVVVGDELGRGGMGIVYLGVQRSLGREVAVKSPRPELRAVATQSLLREAYISGQLEHPNVIPVYALYRDAAQPQLLMRRVEGHEWSEVLAGPRAVGLDANLRTLTQVCHAVHYAHTRGIVHLDLKPSNIMLGAYGELYLLDWGIAVCTRDDLPAFLPRARDVTKIRGTPAYMAPELASGDGAAIDARTDVYLLGAILHELLVGAPPHARPSALESVMAAFEATPTAWPDSVPPELAAIASKALARAPGDRYASAAELREAIEDYLVHADSLHLAAAAQARLDRIDRIMALLASSASDVRAGARSDSDAELDALAGEAEFGFRHALHVWPGNDDARAALQALLERLIVRDLERDNADGAQRRLRDLPSPRPELERRVAEVAAARAKIADELDRFRHDADFGMSARRRSSIAYLGATAWLVSLLVLGWLARRGFVEPAHWHMLAITSGGAAIFATLIWRSRDELFANAINRNAITLLSVGWLMGDLYWIGAWRTQIPFEAAMVGVGPVTVFVICGHAATVDRSLAPHAIVGILALVVIIALPSWGIEIMAIGGSSVLYMLGWSWQHSDTGDSA